MDHKRKRETEEGRRKKRAKKGNSDDTTGQMSADPAGPSQKPNASNSSRRSRIRKLAPPRPFPTVATASSATGPRSVQREGKNNICITRKTKLAAYLRRCKALLVDDGFKELRLSAMGAAIPHLALLAVSLPPILPWAESEVHVDVYTGSVEVHDELLSDSGSEAEGGPQGEFQTRLKSTMNVIIRIGQGEASGNVHCSLPGPVPRTAKRVERRASGGEGGAQQENGVPEQMGFQELDRDGMESS